MARIPRDERLPRRHRPLIDATNPMPPMGPMPYAPGAFPPAYGSPPVPPTPPAMTMPTPNDIWSAQGMLRGAYENEAGALADQGAREEKIRIHMEEGMSRERAEHYVDGGSEFNDPILGVPAGYDQTPEGTLYRPGDFPSGSVNPAYGHPSSALTPSQEEYLQNPKPDQRRTGVYSGGHSVDPNKPARGASPDLGPGSPSAIDAGQAAVGTPESIARRNQQIKDAASGIRPSGSAPVAPWAGVQAEQHPGVVQRVTPARAARQIRKSDGTFHEVPAKSAHLSGVVVDETSPHFGGSFNMRTHKYNPETKQIEPRGKPLWEEAQAPEDVEIKTTPIAPPDAPDPMRPPTDETKPAWVPPAFPPEIETRPPIANPLPAAPVPPREQGNILPIAPVGQPPQPPQQGQQPQQPQPQGPVNEFGEQAIGMDQVPDDGQMWMQDDFPRNRTQLDDLKDKDPIGWSQVLDHDLKRMAGTRTGETETAYYPPWTEGEEKGKRGRAAWNPSEWKHSGYEQKVGWLLGEGVDQIFGTDTAERLARLDWNEFTEWMNLEAPKNLQELYGPAWRETLAEQLGQGWDGIPVEERLPQMKGQHPELPPTYPAYGANSGLDQGAVNYSAEAVEQFGMPTMRIADVVNADNPLMSDATLLNKFRQRAQRNRA